mgnify:CR=1 FL=1
MSPEESELWRKIVIIHNHAKAHLIYCEEADLNQKTFLQPWNELRNALEHIIRAKACAVGLNHLVGDPADYQRANLDKALGHEYRAYFDVCDWLTVVLRQRIRETLAPYTEHPEIIREVIPNYYADIRPALEKLTQQIADVRTRKDIKGDVLEEVEQYNKIVLELKTFADDLSSKVPSLIELKAAKVAAHEKNVKLEQYKGRLGLRNAIIVGLLTVAVGAAITVWRIRTFPERPATIPPMSEQAAETAKIQK